MSLLLFFVCSKCQSAYGPIRKIGHPPILTCITSHNKAGNRYCVVTVNKGEIAEPV